MKASRNRSPKDPEFYAAHTHPRKFSAVKKITMYPALSTNFSSSSATTGQIRDNSRQKSKLKISWSNENQTITRATASKRPREMRKILPFYPQDHIHSSLRSSPAENNLLSANKARMVSVHALIRLQKYQSPVSGEHISCAGIVGRNPNSWWQKPLSTSVLNCLNHFTQPSTRLPYNPLLRRIQSVSLALAGGL